MHDLDQKEKIEGIKYRTEIRGCIDSEKRWVQSDYFMIIKLLYTRLINYYSSINKLLTNYISNNSPQVKRYSQHF